MPHRGRGIQEADTGEGAPRVVVIGYGYWQTRFAGKDDAIGQRLRLDNETHEIRRRAAAGLLSQHAALAAAQDVGGDVCQTRYRRQQLRADAPRTDRRTGVAAS